MKNSIKSIVIAALLVVVIGGSMFLYNKYSKEYKADNFVETTEQQNSEVVTEGDFSVPNFTVLDYDGNEVQLSDYKGKPVVLNFWATWCYYCTEEMPDFNEAYKKYPHVQFLMINATDGYRETIQTAKKYVEEQNFEFDVFFDTKSEAVNAFYVTGFPATFFIDADGNLVTYANGMLDYESLEKGIEMIA